MEWWVKEYGPIDKRYLGFGNINLAKFRFFSPIFQRSIVPTFQPVCRRFVLHPYGVKSKPGPVGQDSLPSMDLIFYVRLLIIKRLKESL